MAVERRGNNLYMYKKVRNGEKVVSRYLGKFSSSESTESLKIAQRLERNNTLADELESINGIEELYQLFVHQCHVVDLHVNQAFHAAGFMKHKRGEWRKTRNGTNK